MRMVWLLWVSLVAAGCASSGSRPERPEPVARVNSGQAVCAAKVPGVYVWMDETFRGARVMYSTTDPAGVDELRTMVQAESRPGAARASGGQPLGARTLPPSEVSFQTLPAGQAVIFTAREAGDAEALREVLRKDVRRQQQGACSAVLVTSFESTTPPAAPLSVTHVAVDENVRKQCNVAPFERLDSTDQTAHAHPLLDQVARCLIDGALPGSRIAIEGAGASPDEYRLRFGQTREQSIADYLVGAGVERTRIDVRRGMLPEDVLGRESGRAVLIKLAH